MAKCIEPFTHVISITEIYGQYYFLFFLPVRKKQRWDRCDNKGYQTTSYCGEVKRIQTLTSENFLSRLGAAYTQLSLIWMVLLYSFLCGNEYKAISIFPYTQIHLMKTVLLILLYVCMCCVFVCMHSCEYTWTTMLCMWRSEDNLNCPPSPSTLLWKGVNFCSLVYTLCL